MSQTHVVIALFQVQALLPIRDWPPAGALIEDVTQAANGGEGLDRKTCRRLSAWARRWEGVPEELRTFYGLHSGHWAVGRALWHALEGYPATPAAGADLHRLWRAEYGVDAQHSLFWAGVRK